MKVGDQQIPFSVIIARTPSQVFLEKSGWALDEVLDEA